MIVLEENKDKKDNDVVQDVARKVKDKTFKRIKNFIVTKISVFASLILAKFLPIILIAAIIFTCFEWLIEWFESIGTVEIIYSALGTLNSGNSEEHNFNSLVEIKGDEKNGYYLDFKSDVDSKIEEAINNLQNTNDTVITLEKELLKKMIKAELITQFPDLGGKVTSGTNQFQGAVKIRRISPNKSYGEIKNTSSGAETKQNVTYSGSDSVNQVSDGEKIYKIGIMAAYSTDAPGAKSPTPIKKETQLKEEELTVRVAKYIEQAFSIYGNIEVVQIGSTEENPNVSNEGRIQKARDENVDALIGIAFNSAGDGTKYENENGVGISYNKDGESDESKKLGDILKSSVSSSMNLNKTINDNIDETGTLGTKDDSFVSLTINGGYLSSIKDYAIISQDLGLQLYAKGVVNGILEYYNIENKGYGTMIDGNTTISSTIQSKVIDLKYVPLDEFEKDLTDNPEQALKEFSLDSNYKLVTATWSYSDGEIKVTKNSNALDYRTIMSKYSMPMEYILFWLIDSQSAAFANGLAELALNSEFVVMIEDNATTTKVVTTTQESYITNQQDENGDYSINVDTEPLRQTNQEEHITERISSKVELIYADSWFVKFDNQLLLSQKSNSTQHANGTVTQSETKSESTNVNSEEWSETETVEEKTVDEDGNEVTEEKEITKNYQKETTTQVTTETTTISNQYKAGDSQVTGNEQKFVTLFNVYNIKGMLTFDWLVDMLENNTKTANMVDITKYLVYKASGIDTGVMTFDFSIYDASKFNNTSTSDTSLDLLVEYLHALESCTTITDDGTKYIVEDDGAGNLTVGHGIDIVNGGYEEVFKEHGYTDVKLGDEIDKDFVDELEKEAIESAVESVKAETASLNLTDYQINALASRYYNMGSGGWKCEREGYTFVEAYNEYWNTTDDKFNLKDPNAVDYNHDLYTKYMKYVDTAKGQVMPGLTKRRQSEWKLFQTGYYDVIDKWHSDGTNGDIIKAADRVHQDEINWTYSVGADLYWGNIEMSMNNPNKVTCCATYVSCAIYKAGYFDESSMNSFNYNECTALYTFLTSAGWSEVNSYDELEPGDIVFMDYKNGGKQYDHVQIYAGNDTWYNAGDTSAIQKASPYNQGEWARNNFSVALRPAK